MKHLIWNLSLKRNFNLILLSVSIILFTNLNVQAQKSLYYGGKFGTSLTQFTDQQPHTSVMQGLTGGIFIGYSLNEKMAVQFEINYLEEGGQLLRFETEDDLGYETWYFAKADNQKISLYNIDLPLMFKYSFSIGIAKLFAIAGPDLGINLYANSSHETTVYANDGNVTTFTGNEDITSNIERYNLGATGGIGFEIPVSEGKYFLIEARYRYGLMPTYKGYSYRGIPQIMDDLKNNTMYFTIGFGF